MAIKLKEKGIDSSSDSFKKMLENLQSNILKSHSRDHVRLLFLQFLASNDTVKAWIKKSANEKVKSAMQQLEAIEARRIAKERGKVFDGGLIANFFFAAEGYEKLGFDTERLKNNGNEIFIKGMKSEKARRILSDPPFEHWEKEYREGIDAMILLADDDESNLIAETDDVKASLNDIARVVIEEKGIALSGGIEHFGYKDGISQPRYFKDDLKKDKIDNNTDKWNPLQPLEIVLVKDPFADETGDNYGSFLVYRKLEQDVEGFNKKIAALAEKLKLTANQKQNNVTTEDFAGALAVGRFKDGTPVVLSDISEGKYPFTNNFDYKSADPKGNKCPFHSHIRKTNPRGQGVLVGERFITRRGIPYGNLNSNDKKGLLFMCFQSSLKKQFNFLQNAWSNAPGFPLLRGRPGIDPLIGMGHEGGQSWPKEYGSKTEINFDIAGFIKMQGGEYFFAPSIGFLKNI